MVAPNLPWCDDLSHEGGRRIRILELDGDILLRLFKDLTGKHKIICEGMPPDAKVVGLSTNHEHPHRLYLAVESEEFGIVEQGYPPMTLRLAFTSWWEAERVSS
jgi:hypothetical protein